MEAATTGYDIIGIEMSFHRLAGARICLRYANEAEALPDLKRYRRGCTEKAWRSGPPGSTQIRMQKAGTARINSVICIIPRGEDSTAESVYGTLWCGRNDRKRGGKP